VFNAGNANACNGDRGLADAREMAELAAAKLGIDPALVLVAETGIIGDPLPMDKVRAGLPRVELHADGGHTAAQAIMTTDTRQKDCAVSVEIGGTEVRIGAMTKGVGMIYPNMATMLAFVGTDAALDPGFAKIALKRVVDRTFNMITVDGDTSTNDSCFLLANGQSGAPTLTANHPDAERFIAALEAVCTDLARKMAADGEGAAKLLQVDVTGAASETDARKAARAVVGSSLVKAALHGEDPNWGRIFMAVGNSGAQIDPNRAALWIGSVQIARDGVTTGASKTDARAQMQSDDVRMRVDLGLGSGSARAWGCDLTEAYVVENSAYST
jgi:glutamate N-acetyltransferase/amino-acid N-acetyltransferase